MEVSFKAEDEDFCQFCAKAAIFNIFSYDGDTGEKRYSWNSSFLLSVLGKSVEEVAEIVLELLENHAGDQKG